MKSFALLAASLAAVALAEECSPLHYVYARATTEAPTGVKESTTEAQFKELASKWWSMGYGAAGAALWLNLTDTKSKERIEGISGYPVPYPADTSGLGGGATQGRSSATVGIDLMVNEIKKRSVACPRQKYILGGHSQGGGVTVGAIKQLADPSKLPKDAFDRIIAVTMFGSPPCPDSVKGKCMSYCHKGDFACDPAAKGNAPKLPTAGGGLPGAPPTGITPPMQKRQTSLFPAECPKDVKESGFVPRTGSQTGAGPHLSYNADGYYIKAAACYIKEKYGAAK